MRALEILYDKEGLLAVNKPAGLPVHKTPDPLRPHLQGLVEAQVGRPLVLFHRLDIDTTGVVLFGTEERLNAPITDMFRDRKMSKSYWAVVDGVWLESWTLVRSFIKKSRGGRWENVPRGRGGDPAETRFRLISTDLDKSWIEAKPLTGRTHQIRLHCLAQRHPILGDRLYGRAHAAGIPIALHARSLGFRHPVTGREIAIEAEPPDYWRSHWLRGLSR